MVDTLIYCDGRWMPHCDFSKDLGLWRSSGVSEVLEAQKHVMLHWEDHYKRLLNSCKKYNPNLVSALPSEDGFKLKIGWLLKMASRSDSVIYIRVTGGDSDNLKDPKDAPKVILRTTAFPSIIHAPLKLMTKSVRRELPEIKLACHYGLAEAYIREAVALGYDSFLYWSPWTGIAEGPYENIFFVTKNNVLVTPKSGVLLGITRKIVLRLARKSRLFDGIEERREIHLGMIDSFDEAFVTSTTKRVHPVARIDGYSHLKTGPDTKTALLRKKFVEYREKYYKERQTF